MPEAGRGQHEPALAVPDHSAERPVRNDGEGEWQDWLVDESDDPGDRARRARGAGEPHGAA